jgi:hypothetical protein
VAQLMVHAGKVLTHNHLLREVWGIHSGGDPQYQRLYVRQLRQKLEANPERPRYILTELGVGYRPIARRLPRPIDRPTGLKRQLESGNRHRRGPFRPLDRSSPLAQEAHSDQGIFPGKRATPRASSDFGSSGA